MPLLQPLGLWCDGPTLSVTWTGKSRGSNGINGMDRVAEETNLISPS